MDECIGGDGLGLPPILQVNRPRVTADEFLRLPAISQYVTHGHTTAFNNNTIIHQLTAILRDKTQQRREAVERQRAMDAHLAARAGTWSPQFGGTMTSPLGSTMATPPMSSPGVAAATQGDVRSIITVASVMPMDLFD